MGNSRRLWVLGVDHGRWVIVCGRWVVVGGAGLSIGDGGAPLHGRVAHGCWFVVRWRGGDLSSAVWSALARLEGTRVGVLTIDNSITNNEQQHCCRSSFGCHVTLGDVAPANRPCRGLCGHWLARADGRSAVTQHGEQRRTTTLLSFIIWLPRRSQRRGTCTPPILPLLL